MSIEFYKPLLEALNPYLEGYYFVSPGEHSKPLHYWTFPNNFFIVSVSLGAAVHMQANQIIVTPSASNTLISDYVSSYTTPIEVIYQGAVKEITLYFKPLGIQQFIQDAPLLFQQKTALNFNPFPDFMIVMKQILEMSDRDLQRKTLENYWLSKRVVRDLHLMKEIIQDIESEQKIEDIAHKNGFSRQHLRTMVTRAVGKSPSEYRKVHRFRTAIHTHKPSMSLTELSYESLFYDQSHLIKDFKQLTRINPHSFFKKVATHQACIWLFL